MTPPSYRRSVVDRNVVMRRMTVFGSLFNNTSQQRFCPMGKNVYFWCIFGLWIEICFQNFSITHIFRWVRVSQLMKMQAKLTTVWFVIQHLQEPVLLMNHASWVKGDLKDNVRDLNLSKQQDELLVSRLKGWIFCVRTLRCVFTVGAMKNSRISSPRKICVLQWCLFRYGCS